MTYILMTYILWLLVLAGGFRIEYTPNIQAKPGTARQQGWRGRIEGETGTQLADLFRLIALSEKHADQASAHDRDARPIGRAETSQRLEKINEIIKKSQRMIGK